MIRTNIVIFISLFVCILQHFANAQTKCIIETDTFNYIGEYKYNHNYFTEDTIINKENIGKYFNNISSGKYYFKYDTSLCAFSIKNGYFDNRLYYFDGSRLTLYNEYTSNLLKVKYISWGGIKNPHFDVSFYFNGNRKMYIKQNGRKPYIITLNGRKTAKTYFIKRRIKHYFNLYKQISYPIFITG